MESIPPSAGEVCSVCGAPLSDKNTCLACLLRAGLEETVAEEAPPPTRFGDYEIARREDGTLWELGRGAMGVTYRAIDRELHRNVALKVITTSTEAKHHRAVRERFLREARAAAALRHVNVAGVFRLGVSPEIGCCYYAMELVEGETLKTRVERDGPLAIGTVLEIVSQVTSALLAAAQRGLVHRDLKPSNLMLTESDGPDGKKLEVKVIDFGLAKAVVRAVGEQDLTQGGFIGTPLYASPEQFDCDGVVDARSDIYALAATCWYALTGQVPFVGRGIAELFALKNSARLPLNELRLRKVPAPVVSLLTRALAADPADRPASAREFFGQLEACRRQLSVGPGKVSSGPPERRRWRFVIGSAWVVVVLAVAGALGWRSLAPPRPIEDKSIAVLPFLSVSVDHHPDTSFADAVQDEIMADLAKIADLKVISHVSVASYQDNATRDRRDIARQLRVAYLLEGSVRQEGDRRRMIVRLVNAQTSAVLWADQYDVRDLSDKFTVQSKIAQTIAEKLQAKLSPSEKAAIDALPTEDPAAYDAYVRGQKSFRAVEWTQDEMGLRQAARQFEEATTHDPHFFLAWCELARVNLDLHWYNHDHASECLARAERAVQTARQLQPRSGEMHLLEGKFLYMARRDFAAADDELQKAARLLPNSAETMCWLGYASRRQGLWDDSVRHFERAVVLDPRDANLYLILAETFQWTRRYDDARQALDQAVAIDPRSPLYLFQKANCAREEKGDNEPLRRWVRSSVPADSESWGDMASMVTAELAISDADYSAATRALGRYRLPFISYAGFNWPTKEQEGRVLLLQGDHTAARAAFAAARQSAEQSVRERPQDPKALMVLARIDAELDLKEAAIREGREACAALPLSADAIDGSFMIQEMAGVYALTGETDQAVEALRSVVGKPVGPAYGDLLFRPVWSSLHGDPRFEALVASLAPKP